jgi:hypothetical protein
MGEDWERPENIKMPSSNKQPYFIERAESLNLVFTVRLEGSLRERGDRLAVTVNDALQQHMVRYGLHFPKLNLQFPPPPGSLLWTFRIVKQAAKGHNCD